MTPSRRDTLSALMYSILNTSPALCLTELADALASVALVFAYLEQSEARQATAYQTRRERVLLLGLAQALKVAEKYDLAETLRIVDEVAPPRRAPRPVAPSGPRPRQPPSTALSAPGASGTARCRAWLRSSSIGA